MASEKSAPAWCSYIFNPLSGYRRRVLTWLRAASGNVLDVGCGDAGLYWALSYLPGCSSVSFLDRYRSNLEQLEQQLTATTPSYLEQSFGDALVSGILPDTDSCSLASSYHHKVAEFTCCDLLSENPEELYGQFDTLVAVQSIQCVDSEEELSTFIKQLSSLLKTGGKLLGVSLQYEALNSRLEALLEGRYEGRLNPNERLLDETLAEAGFIDRRFESTHEDIPKNYSKLLLLSAVKEA